MSEDVRAWKLVFWGLTLKLAGMWVLLATPLIAFVAFGFQVSTAYTVMGIALAPLLPDFIGRCLCLAAPIPQRVPILLSVASQGCGVVGLVMFAVGAGDPGVAIGLMWAVACQSLAAGFFTRFLKNMVLRNN